MAKKKNETVKEVGDYKVDTATGEVIGKKDEVKVSKRVSKLDDYKKKINYVKNDTKPQTWLSLGDAFQEITGLPGIPESHVTMVYGKSDVGKTSILIKAAAAAQAQGKLPVLIITEKKWSWERAETMGFSEDFVIMHDEVECLEDCIDIMKAHIKEQEEGELDFDLVFLWDSVGGTPARAEWEKAEKGESGGGMMLASRVLKEQVGRYLSHKITNTRKADYPYKNTLLMLNQGYTSPPDSPMGQPKLVPNGGEGIYYCSSLVLRMGGIKSGARKHKATHQKKTVVFAIESDLAVEKNHISELALKGKIICAAHGFILPTEINKYKDQYKKEWQVEVGDLEAVIEFNTEDS